MNARHFSSVVFFAGSVLLPASLFAQAHDASVANHEPHYYDITDWDIDNGSSSLDNISFLNISIVTQDDDTNVISLKIQGHTLDS